MVRSDPARRIEGTVAGAGFRRLPDPLSLLLLLAVLAPVGIVFGQVSFWHRFVQPWPAFLCGAACCGLAAMNRRPGWWLAVSSLLGALFVVIVLYRLLPGPTLALRDYQLRSQLMHWLDQLRGGAPIHDDLAVDAWSTAVAWAAGAWAAWAALRAGWHWMVLAAAGAVLASSIGYLPHWPATGLAIFIFASLLFVARLHHRQLVGRALARGDMRQSGDPRAWSAHLAAVALGALGLVALGWLAPAMHLHAPDLLRQPNPSTGNGVIVGDAAGGRTVLHDFGSSLHLSGPISLGDEIVATVDASSSGYLFGVAYDRYQGDGWVSTAVDQVRRQVSDQPARPTSDIAGGSARLGLHLSSEDVYEDNDPVELTVRPTEPASVLLAAGPPLGVSRPATAGAALSVSPRGLNGAPSGELSELVATQPLQPGATYSTRGLVSTAGPDALRDAGGQPPEWVRSSYLQLPASLPERVRSLATDLTNSSSNDYDRALAIERYLRRMPYDQNIAAPPPNEDGVDYLLFVAGRGYCDYFASAMAVMLRSVGVPARVVAGYVMHESGPAGVYQVREHDAHAWTEVFFPGFGWQRFDPTPGGASSFATASGQVVAPGLTAPALAGATPASVPAPAQSAASQPPSPGDGPNAGPSVHWPAAGHRVAPWLIWISLAGLVALTWAYWWLQSQRNPHRAAVSAWRSSTLAARAAERPQNPHETPAEYAAAIVRSVPPASAMQDLAAIYGRARYGRPGAALPAPTQSWRNAALVFAGLLRGRLSRRR